MAKVWWIEAAAKDPKTLRHARILRFDTDCGRSKYGCFACFYRPMRDICNVSLDNTGDVPVTSLLPRIPPTTP